MATIRMIPATHVESVAVGGNIRVYTGIISCLKVPIRRKRHLLKLYIQNKYLTSQTWKAMNMRITITARREIS
jgi:hypothetical protein